MKDVDRAEAIRYLAGRLCEQVEELSETERGDGGYGSTGVE